MEPFKISIPEQQLHDLSIRLKQVRWPSSFSIEPWALGTDYSFLMRLVDYDFGYDISDYRDIDPMFGSLDDMMSIPGFKKQKK
uniref:epoxide hydrolase N-terminal domain-containing protein n=1 Tax=Paenibacillus sp. FSL H8-0168 TaxID=2921378 RepID=UPI00406C2198